MRIQEQRDQFYELNYYTTQQLLLLREELVQIEGIRAECFESLGGHGTATEHITIDVHLVTRD